MPKARCVGNIAQHPGCQAHTEAWSRPAIGSRDLAAAVDDGCQGASLMEAFLEVCIEQCVT